MLACTHRRKATSCAEICGCILGTHSIFRVIAHSSSSVSHKCSGKFVSAPHIPVIKYDLKVWIAHYVALRRCVQASISWYYIFIRSNMSYTSTEHLLFNIQNFGLKTFLVRSLINFSKTTSILIARLLLRGLARIAFESIL